MAGEYTAYWSQLVRTPGRVEVLSHSAVEVAPIGAPSGTPGGRPGIRLQTRPIHPVNGPYLIDMTATATIAMLEGWLASGAHVGKSVGWRSRGFGVRRRDTLHIKPLGG